jgi:cytochrome c oxidase subunit 2
VNLRNPAALILACLPLGACEWRIQNALAPAGPHADIVATLSWVMFIGGGLIFVFVMALSAYAVWAPAERRAWLGHRRTIIAGGLAFPIVTLTALLIYGFFIFRGLHVEDEPLAARIEVIGERFWWRVNYYGEDGELLFVTANEIRMPTGRPVLFVLKAQDVIHSFWVPALAGKLDMIPAHVNEYAFAAERPGVYRGQCAEFCGAQHTKMAFYVVALLPDEYEAWVAEQMEPADEPDTPFLEQGKRLFLANGCGSCHRVAGTPADGLLGPDLTHIGSRLSLAAGVLPNNIGTLGGWISSAQHIKPDNLMPSFGNLQGEELRAIAAYMESLK